MTPSQKESRMVDTCTLIWNSDACLYTSHCNVKKRKIIPLFTCNGVLRKLNFQAFYRVFSLTWPTSMQIYWNKRKRLHKKRVQLPEDWFGAPSWPPFHCFGTPIWPPWRHVKTLYREEGRRSAKGALGEKLSLHNDKKVWVKVCRNQGGLMKRT